MEHLLEFYGEECPHCITMRGFSLRLEKEEGIKIKRYEIWHNKDNEKIYEEHDKDPENPGEPLCGGVPFFYNTKTKKFVCGDSSYEELKDWAMGK